MPHTPDGPGIDLQEVATRNRKARTTVAQLIATNPSTSWQHVVDALADTPLLATEVTRFRARLQVMRLHRANLAAAARATLAAHRDGEPEPLSYLRDELTIQGYGLRGRP
ncbi:hypothetical protein [Actinomadura sp. HBU206391]|uniref:hypothetical protein n=1 Tax=Actinomadura sp. HBU206391 TaxID=2731692 RepID=UPI00164FD88F|nr:hypothetical protein [Actinomadura sp. HBU206391]MBC6456342.1 hypothetical protein [Actinomadura sp. HBU206391]